MNEITGYTPESWVTRQMAYDELVARIRELEAQNAEMLERLNEQHIECNPNLCKMVQQMATLILKLETELAVLRERTRWISVQERLPGQGDEVITLTDGDYLEISIFYNGKFTFRDYGFSSEVQGVTHWQPRPTRPGVKP